MTSANVAGRSVHRTAAAGAAALNATAIATIRTHRSVFIAILLPSRPGDLISVERSRPSRE
jgi:hypothetical protein